MQRWKRMNDNKKLKKDVEIGKFPLVKPVMEMI